MFSLFETSTPQLYLDIDRTKAQLLGVNVPDVFAALQIYLGSSYVNDFNLFGRTFRVTAQADGALPPCSPSDVLKHPRAQRQRRDRAARLVHHRARHCRARIACRATISIRRPSSTAPRRPATRQGQAIAVMEKIAARDAAGRLRLRVDDARVPADRAPATPRSSPSLLAVVFVFLVLAAQYESLTLPLAVILIVPMCLVASIVGVVLRGQDNNILTQVGFVVLIGLAAKNAILIVEFAKQLEDQGRDRFAAAVEAARLRLRPILMTSFAFIFGVVPLVWAVGAGAELRQTLGTAVFSGMIGVTVFGLIFTPVFYVVCRWIADKLSRRRAAPRAGDPSGGVTRLTES